MKQAEKTKNTYNKILQSAIIEFGEKGYDNSSINTICKKNDISKGLIYHNFKNKDELYLKVVKECFEKLITCIKEGKYVTINSLENMKQVIILRQEFFDNNIDYRNIFFEAVLMPPKHLKREIQKIRKELDEFNKEIFKSVLKNVKLRNGITEEMAISYFEIYQEMFNTYFQKKMYENKDIQKIGSEHDLKVFPMINVMLYGIAEEKKEDKND